MTKKTPPPPVAITRKVPALRALRRSAVRLHPERGEPDDPTASKIGGLPLWPADEPWPLCQETEHQTETQPVTAFVLQLNTHDLRGVAFRPKYDLFQLFWCPTDTKVHGECPLIRSFWRNSKQAANPIKQAPAPELTESYNYVPKPCRVSPEQVTEYPLSSALSRELSQAIDDGTMSPWDQYDNELSACPSTKVGGHPYWVQNAELVLCDCGQPMEFFIQLVDWEYTNVTNYQRWVPLDDRWAVKNPGARKSLPVTRPTGFEFGHEVYYIFLCRSCPEWPCKMIYQR